MKIYARLKLTAESWFDTLTEEQKKAYLEEHPDSKYAKGYKPKEEQKEAIDVNDTSFEYDEKEINDWLKENPRWVWGIKRKYGDEDFDYQGAESHFETRLMTILRALKNPNFTDELKGRLRKAFKMIRKDGIISKALRHQAYDNFWKTAKERYNNTTEEQKQRLEEARKFDNQHPRRKNRRLVEEMRKLGLLVVPDGYNGWISPFYSLKRRDQVGIQEIVNDFGGIPSKENIEKARQELDRYIGLEK